MQNKTIKHLTLICCSFLLLALDSMSQEDIQYRFFEDINGDHKNDSVVVTKSFGIGSFFCQVDFFINGSRPVSIKTEHNSAAFTAVLPIPDEISNLQFIKKLSDSIFRLQYSDSLSSDVKWMAQVTSNSQFIKAGTIDFRSSFTPAIVSSPIDVTRGSVTMVDRSLIQELKAYFTDDNGEMNYSGYKRYLLAYYAHNHKRLKYDATRTVWATHHGVYYIDSSNTYTCLFINDANIFGIGSERLRWPSIINAVKGGDYVAIRTFAMPSEHESLYIISLKKGQVVRLNKEYLKVKNYNNPRIKDNVLYFGRSTLDIPTLFER